jgi:hypothetical protein
VLKCRNSSTALRVETGIAKRLVRTAKPLVAALPGTYGETTYSTAVAKERVFGLAMGIR